MRLLLVEDQAALLKALRQGLEEEGFAVDTAADGEEADVKARTTPYDVIVLDIVPRAVSIRTWVEIPFPRHFLSSVRPSTFGSMMSSTITS